MVRSELLYVSGPLFTTAQRGTQEDIAKIGAQLGFEVYLPQANGLEFAMLSMIPSVDQVQLSNAVFLVDVAQLIRASTIVVNCNGDTPDSGSIVEASFAYLWNKQVILYRDDVRSFIGTLPLNPMVLGLRYAPIAKTMTDIYTLLVQAKNHALSAVIPFDPNQILFLGTTLLFNRNNTAQLAQMINSLAYIYPNATTF